MKQCLVSEDKLPQKLSVITSPKISKQIEVIDNYNQNNIDALSQWNEYIEGLKSYISNRSIAWDYNNKYPRFPNGAIHLEELGYDVTFIVKTSHITNRSYVYVFMLNLKPEEFGLKVPPKGNCQSQVNNQLTNNLYVPEACNYQQKNVLYSLDL